MIRRWPSIVLLLAPLLVISIFTSASVAVGASPAALTSRPDNIIGFIEGSDSHFRIRILNSVNPPANPAEAGAGLPESFQIEASPETLSILNHVKAGNRIAGTGRILVDAPGEKKLWLDAIQTIGFKKLLGTWQSNRSEIFEFKDFSRLVRWQPLQYQRNFEFFEVLDYAITPDHADSFSIFITDGVRRMTVGTLSFEEPDSIAITIYNSTTGEASERISLSPLYLR